ncbi:FAD-dependent oxidoreductase [Aneurinibacillus sp. REN35]|uniref:FAD-dependent oxidoreductase n=1 Tax=Aneurinibacillus sp. REN35 TaxID=3237286 RepID=UPI003529A43A
MAQHPEWDIEADVVVIGAGGGGLTAALAASRTGAEVIIFEKTEFVLGNTAASAGMIPAAGTAQQRELGIDDSAETMMHDILRKNNKESDLEVTRALCEASGPLIDWMTEELAFDLSVVTEFRYPGHSRLRMHAPPSRAGEDLVKMLKRALQKQENAYLMLRSPVVRLYTDERGAIIGVEADTPQGAQYVRAKKVILASNGFGGNMELVKKYIPEIAEALYFGYEANTGDAIMWGEELGAALSCMSGFQGHSSVAPSHGILMTWGGVMSGGFLTNKEGRRFGNEAQGYSEFALEVMKQPEGYANYIFDAAIYNQLGGIEDFRRLDEMNAFKKAETPAELAQKLGMNPHVFEEEVLAFNQAVASGVDAFGRTHLPKKLEAPLYGLKVVPALFHTQGGLKINRHAQVLKKDGNPIPNLYAVGGAAAGVSGRHPKGYMSGNGLLAALGFGKIAGDHAAAQLSENMKAGGIIL